MNSERLQNWLAEVVIHTHVRLDRLLPLDEAEREAQSHDGFISIEALVWYAKKFFGKNDIFVCDTDHPVNILSRKGVLREGCFDSSRLSDTIDLISEKVFKRAEILRNSELSPNILTGIEVDIIAENGLLDVNDFALSQLDIVIASFHYIYWKEANGGLKPDVKQYINSLKNAASNLNVDIIGHPTRELKQRHMEQMQIEEWDGLFRIMSQNDVAYEINLSDFFGTLAPEKRRLEEELIKRASNLGVKFIVGLDFHHFNHFGSPIESSQYFDIDSISEAFQRNRGGPNLRFFLQLRRIKRELEILGVSSDTIINSDKEKLTNWLSKRK